MREPVVPPISDWRGIQFKGPLTLTDWKLCSQCSDFIEPGQAVWLLEKTFMLDDYIHVPCAPEFLSPPSGPAGLELRVVEKHP